MYGQSVSCTQTITIESDNPFLESDINWPGNYEMNGCDTIQANPSVTGEPTWPDNKCALVASTYDDQYFFISGSACIKVLREWTVIDWCQYEAGGTIGIWSYLQEIKLKNNIAPNFIVCEDQDICSYDDDCTSELVTITAYANDDCTDSLNLLYLWELDIDDDGTIDESGQGIEFSKELLFGVHRVFWTVEDGCGNSNSCDYKLTVRDCKNPTPYCNSSITTTIMPSAGMIQVWAEDFDFGSYDNCTAQEDLIFSFSTDIGDDNRVILCEDIENGIAQIFTFELWVTDEHGNQERCDVTFIVQDNGNACNDFTIKGKVSGKVLTQDEKFISDVEMDYTASIDTFSGMQMTDSIGEFVLESTPEYLKYVIRPSYESDPKLGVSTLDLVMIQQHILGIKPFDNPYDIIASDVSNNSKISSSDLLILRKMILGIISVWPKEIENWVFVDSAYVFPDESYPYKYPDSIVIETLMDTVDQVNFVAVKMGDVNGSFKPSFKEDKIKIEARNDNSFEAIIHLRENVNGSMQYDLMFDHVNEEVDGMQFSMHVPDDVIIESDFLSEEDFVVMDGILKVSWINSDQSDIDGESFLKMTSNSPMKLTFTETLTPEIYIGLEPYHLDIKMSNTLDVENFGDKEIPFITAYPTLFRDDLNLKISNFYETIQLEVMDSRGRSIFRNVYYGERELTIPSSHFQYSGVYFVKAIVDRKQHTLKVIRI